MELRGAAAAKAICENLAPEIARLSGEGVTPCLAVIRVGARGDDVSYERGIMKRFDGASCRVRSVVLDADCTQRALEEALLAQNADPDIHGILVLRPLPRSFDEKRIAALIDPDKDVDCMSDAALGRVMKGGENAFAPCTAEAVVRILEHYAIPTEGSNALIVGRSLVVGKPLAMLLLAKNATVTVCHTRTKELAAQCRRADILVASVGKAHMISPDFIGANCTVADVGINAVDGAILGDVSDEANAAAANYTPVPGGVGSMTSAVLLEHTVRAAAIARGERDRQA